MEHKEEAKEHTEKQREQMSIMLQIYKGLLQRIREENCFL